MTPSNCFVFCFVAVVITCVLGHGQMLGGRTNADVNDEKVKQAADFAEVEVNKKSNAMYYMVVTEIVKAQKQLVNGMNYFLTLEMTSTSCKKSKTPKFPPDLESCKQNNKGDAHTTQICDVTVYVARNMTSQLIESKCESAKETKL